MLGKTTHANSSFSGLEVFPEITQQIYRKRLTVRSLDYSFRKGHSRTVRTDSGGTKTNGTLRTPLKAANRPLEEFLSEQKLRTAKEEESLNWVSPLRSEFQWVKTLVASPKPKKTEENALAIEAKRLYFRIKPPSTAKKPSTARCTRSFLATADFAKPVEPVVREVTPLYISVPSESILKWKHSVRVAFQRRSEMGSHPLAIVHFTGLLGDFSAAEPWGEAVDLHLYQGWEKGLQRLANKLQVAIFADCSKRDCERLRDTLRKKEVHVDAVYRRRKGLPAFAQDYEQMISDFGMAAISASHVLVMSALHLDASELQYRSGWDLLYDPSLSSSRRLCVSGLPVPANKVSLLFLAPNPRAQENLLSVGFDYIAKSLLKVTEARPGNLYKSFGAAKKRPLANLTVADLPFFDYMEKTVILRPPRNATGKRKGRLRLAIVNSGK